MPAHWLTCSLAYLLRYLLDPVRFLIPCVWKSCFQFHRKSRKRYYSLITYVGQQDSKKKLFKASFYFRSNILLFNIADFYNPRWITSFTNTWGYKTPWKSASNFQKVETSLYRHINIHMNKQPSILMILNYRFNYLNC